MEMTEEIVYVCKECHNVVKATGEGQYDPECCGAPMKQVPLTECRKDPAFAEHARFIDEDEPCG
ncbi:MAG: hypothetical protein R6V01_05505 [Thermoplasmatota archaeon]